MKHGIGRLTACLDATLNQSKLTQVSHKAPMRWLPLRSSKIETAGAAVAATSSYGAGFLPGDVQQVELKVGRKAKLGVITQGSNRVYKPKANTTNSKIVQSTLWATVEEDAFLVLAPDPTVPFCQSRFHQQQEFVVHPTASLIAIDWISSGRFANGERWQANQIALETKLRLMDGSHTTPLVWDATTLSQQPGGSGASFGFDLGRHQSFNAYASVLMYGNQTLEVVQRLQDLQYQLALPHTRLRAQQAQQQSTATNNNLGTTGRVLLGVNQLDVDAPQPVHVARWAAFSNEDLYRTLHNSLQSLAPSFGLEFYQDRIRATSSGPCNKEHKVNIGKKEETTTTIVVPSSLDDQIFSNDPTTKKQQQHQQAPTACQSWHAYMLADSALPTGSFAHSAGLEAASQLGLLDSSTDQHDEHHVGAFIEASTRSTLQQATPWILAGHGIETTTTSKVVDEWERLDRHVHSVLVCSAPACRASIDQGRNLLRVALPWLQESSSLLLLLQAIQEGIQKSSHSGHLAPLFGIVAKALGLGPQEACHLLGYCVARDVVSAAVRLNLIGPLKSVALLSKTQAAAQEGIESGLSSTGDQELDDTDKLLWSNGVVGGCAPVVDAIHPCHDLLAVRLFRT